MFEFLKLLCREILTTSQSDRALGRHFGISGSTVSRYRMRLAQEGLDAPAIENLNELALDRRLNDGRYRNKKDFIEPEWASVHAELQRPGVDLRMIHTEYVEEAGEGFMSETEFRRRFDKYSRTRGLVMRMVRRPGELLFVDYSGKRPHVTNPETGERTPVELYVSIMGASRETFAIATYTQQLPDWIFANCKALDFYGAVPQAFVPDNLKSAVTKRTRKDGILLNPSYAEFAYHYRTSIQPARPVQPNDKAPVEVAVRIAQRYILGRLRNRTFFSLDELNAAIAIEVDRINSKLMKSLGKSRNQLFEELDRPAMKPLPMEPFAFGEWKVKVRIPRDYHIVHDGRFYSVPYTLVGQLVNVKVLREGIEIYHNNQRIAEHAKVVEQGGSHTLQEHRPHNHQSFTDAQPGEMLAWASRSGEAIYRFVMADADRRRSPMLTVQLCQRLQKLVREYGEGRVQAACVRALDLKLVNIANLRSLLSRGLDHVPAHADSAANDDRAIPAHENVRGASYYA